MSHLRAEMQSGAGRQTGGTGAPLIPALVTGGTDPLGAVAMGTAAAPARIGGPAGVAAIGQGWAADQRGGVRRGAAPTPALGPGRLAVVDVVGVVSQW